MKKLAIMFAAAMLVAGCGGGKGSAPPGNPSNNTSVCAYTKRVGSRGRVYVQMAAAPSSQEPTACSAFNGGFGERRIPVVGTMGTAARRDACSAARSTPATGSSATADERAQTTLGWANVLTPDALATGLRG